MCRRVTANFSGRGSAGNFLEVAEIWLESRSAIRYLVLSCFIIGLRKAVTDMEPQDKWLTIEELSGYLKMSRSKLYQMAQKGELLGSKIGTQWRFDRDEIDDWVKSKRPAADKKSTGETK
ncbi:DNA binding domain protein, excisionase family [Dehalogenimonas lykanthroporepellens BL-DC-9]|nr:DNA binding domain protein, excisionase family [Dehalogenimonas lykanthroporepellens BL-DC-9]